MAHVEETWARWLGSSIIENNNEITLFGGKKYYKQPNGNDSSYRGLSYFEERTHIEIYTDSNYLKDGIESWIHSWKKMDGKLPQKTS